MRRPQTTLYKVNTGWLRSVVGLEINATFADAWSSIINALEGSWGTTSFRSFNNEEVFYDIIKGKYLGTHETSLEGLYTITLPYESKNLSKVLIEVISGNEVTSSTTYIIEQGSLNIDILLPNGRKLITISGTARRI
jgi:hypothetical protein